MVLYFFCLKPERPQATDNVNLSIPKSWRDLLLYECQLHGRYSGSATPPTNADCMNRLYGVEPHTDCRDIWDSGHDAQKPGSQVHSEGFGLQSLCPAFSCPQAALLLPSPCCTEWWSSRTDRSAGGVSVGFTGLGSCLSYSVLLYISRESPLELCFNSSGF